MITATDLFAGAGGSSTGATQAGVQVVIAANHWRLAVDVHHENHPDTDHDCADISQVDPRRYPRTHILLGSPECTWHSNAAGRRRMVGQESLPMGEKPLPLEAGERSRATMWDIPRFAEHHLYRAVIVENVVEAAKWPPFRAWLMAMDAIGYEHELVCHNSMHAQMAGLPAPQSRDRLYVVFWRRGDKRPDLEAAQRPPAWCVRCETVVESRKAWKQSAMDRVGKYRQQYVYVCACGQAVEPAWLPAAAAIDWDLPAQMIGERSRPLSPKTLARIREGLRRHGGGSLAPAGGTWHTDAHPTTDPMRTLTTTEAHGLLVPVEGRAGKTASTVTEPMRTQTTRNETALLMPYYGATQSAKPVSEPMGTVTTVDRHALITLRGQNVPKPVSDPLDTVTAGGNHHALLDMDELVERCRFRMLEPHEIAAGMAFPADYIWRGTKRERVKLAGNAVTPPAERDLVAVVAEGLAA